MKNLNKIKCLSIKILTFFFTTILVSCAQFGAPERLAIKGQPGDYFVNQIKDQNLSSQEDILAMLQHPHFKSKKTKSYLVKDVQETATLLQIISQSQDISQAITQLTKTQPNKTDKWLRLALQLYPINAYRILEQLYAESSFQEAALESAALSAGLDPARILQTTATSGLEYRIVPLIHSASLTVYNQNESTQTRLWFKQNTSSEWLPALSLQWEPIMGALSGSIVHLQPETEYDIKLEYLNDNQLLEEQYFSFVTRANTPPIDPNKIYYLSDIYTGGQLNLTTLGIEGTEDGWALIIGDNTDIVATEDDVAAIDIGKQRYIKFENITVKGGQRYGITANKANHIWIDGCNISEYGQEGLDIRDGIAYATIESTSPINYDSGIYLERTGIVTIENCEIHNPRGQANHWGQGHPYGPSAMLIRADHPTENYRGQYIIRNNRFYGSDSKRFNDVIESRSNGRAWGGFVRDSAIHDNYLAYANDDIIELDGGQSNVLFYNNNIEQGFCGVSAVPNMGGPSYIFNNYIHNLGDDRQYSWGAIKLGGLLSAPAGIVNIFENFIKSKSNGITNAGFKNDYTFWANVKNNIILLSTAGSKSGFGINDYKKYWESNFSNNLIFNFQLNTEYNDAVITSHFHNQEILTDELLEQLNNTELSTTLELPESEIIPNFSQLANNETILGIVSTIQGSRFNLTYTGQHENRALNFNESFKVNIEVDHNTDVNKPLK